MKDILNTLQRFWKSQFHRNMISGALASGVNIIILLFSYRMYLQYLGYELYGLWLVLAAILAFVQMGELGIGPAITKLVAEEKGKDDLTMAQGYIACGLLILTIAGVAVTALVIVLRSPILGVLHVGSEHAGIAYSLLPFVGLLCTYGFIVNTLNATLSGLGRVDLANYLLSARNFIAVLTSYLLLISGRGVESILIGSGLALLVNHGVSILLIRRLGVLHVWDFSSLSSKRVKRLLHFGGAVFGSSLLSMFVEPFSKLMLAHYAGLASVPIFHLALRGAVLSRSIVASGISAIMPEISKLGGAARQNVVQTIQRVNRRGLIVICLCALPLYAALFVGAEPMLTLWLKQQYDPQIVGTFRIILACIVLSSLGLPAYYTAMGLGKVYDCMLSNGIIAGINVISICAVVLFAGTLTPNRIAYGLVLAFGISTLYIVIRARQATGSLVSAPSHPVLVGGYLGKVLGTHQ